MPLVIFNLQLGPYQVLQHWVRVDLGAMTMKGCSAFPLILTMMTRCFTDDKGSILRTLRVGEKSFTNETFQKVSQ